ncbi:MAG: methyltransferase domain-containing protein [Coriobacteriia bacterium]|nr:methyltransferase domain-containing protein [Coriobacteriia bacterium]
MRLADYPAAYRISTDYQDYYDKLAAAQGTDPLATARTRDAEGTMTPLARDVMFNVSAEIKNTFNEYACNVPPLLESCTVVNLCSGSGRDLYVLAQLVGENGKVIGVEPNAARRAIAEKYLTKEIKQFGYAASNVELVAGCPEDLSMIASDTADVVYSNCTFNASPDKYAYLCEVQRVLKTGGEFYFTDVFSDCRLDPEIANNIAYRAEYLGGAMYINDFRRLSYLAGFNDPRYLVTNKTILTEEEQSHYPQAAFATITCRLMNSEVSDDVCENFGEYIAYNGQLPDFPEYFLFDKDIKFPTGKECQVCNNVAAVAAYGSRYAKVFTYKGSQAHHIGDTHGDHIIKVAPDFDGIADEDDQPIMASCC